MYIPVLSDNQIGKMIDKAYFDIYYTAGGKEFPFLLESESLSLGAARNHKPTTEQKKQSRCSRIEKCLI